MKTRILIATILSALIVVFALVRAFSLSQNTALPYESGRHSEFTIHIPKGTNGIWSYQPSHIDLGKGDRFSVTIMNDDDIPRGFALDTFGVNETLPRHISCTTRELYAKNSVGPVLYCSVMCGKGMVATGTHRGESRGYFDMEGIHSINEAAPPNS